MFISALLPIHKLADISHSCPPENDLLFSAGPGQSSKMFDNDTLPELPSVPDTFPTNSIGRNTTTSDDIDFDDLTRRFEELKKKT